MPSLRAISRAMACVGRIDYNMGSSNTIFGRYLFDQENLTTPPQLPPPANSNGREFKLRAQGASAHWNHVVSPSLINNFTLGYTRYHNLNATLNSFKQDLITPAGITNTLAATDPLFWSAPIITVTGLPDALRSDPELPDVGKLPVAGKPVLEQGKPQHKIGGDIRNIREHMFYTGSNGATQFQNAYTGNNVADFLMGFPSNVSKTARATVWGSHVDYLWRIHSGRLEDQLPADAQPGPALRSGERAPPDRQRRRGFRCQNGNAAHLQVRRPTLPAILNFYKNIRTDVPIRVYDHRAPYDADTNNIAPRVGFAYRLAPRTVIRGGYGIYYDSPQIQSMASANDFAPNTLRPSGPPIPGCRTSATTRRANHRPNPR